MQVEKVIGYQRSDFTGDNGNKVEGYWVYLSWEVSPNQGAGFASDRIYLTTTRINSMGLSIESLLNRNVHVYYTKSGKLGDIVLAD